MATAADLQAILDGPALVAPSGETYQFENPPNIDNLCFAVLGTFLGLALLAFCIRLYTRWIILHDLSKDDYLLLVGMILYTTYIGICIKLVFLGAGTHQWDIQVKNMKSILFFTWLAELVYCLNVIAIKVSILLQYLRIFHHVGKATFIYISSWATLWLIVLVYCISLLIIAFACTPINKSWDPLILTGHCVSIQKISITTGSFNVISDFVLLLLPQYEIWKLHISPRKKAAVSGVFFVAFCACISSILRLYYSSRINWAGDVSYDITFQGNTAAAELSIAIICCYLPVSPKFFQKVINPKIRYLTKGSLWTRTRSQSSIVIREHSMGGTNFDSMQNNTSNLPIYGTYSTLDETELENLKTKESDIPSGNIPEPNLIDLTRRIRMTQEIMVESSNARGVDSNLEGQSKVTSEQMGW